jgi:lipoyl(octanoyl) transferase
MSELELRVDPVAPGRENMRRDVELLERCAHGDIAGVIRIYSFSPPCLSIGRNQDAGDVDRAACTRDGIDVVRRPSGGRAVLHRDEVTYAVICRTTEPHFGGPVLESCARIHAVVATALAGLGVTATPRAASADEAAAARARAGIADCFAHPSAHELIDARGLKLVGSAQARLGDALLQHGSILLRPHGASTYLRGSQAATRSSSLHEILGREVDQEEVVAALRAGFAKAAAAQATQTTS